MHNVTVMCQSRGKELTYRTTFISTAGIAVCSYCGVRDRAATPRGEPTSPLDAEAHAHSEVVDPAGSRKGGLT